MKNTFLSIALLTFTLSFAQTNKNVWKQTTKSALLQTIENKKTLPNPRLFTLDVLQLKQSLVAVPKRYASKEKSNTIVSFPNHEGQLENFSIQEMSNMDTALAAKYPEIKSYVGQGIENPTARIYFSISPLGLQSMTIYADRSAVFIEPYTTDLNTYVVYRKIDKTLSSANPFECKVINAVQNGLQSADITARPNADDAFMRTFRLALSVTGEYTVYFGGTKALALAAMNNTMTRVNGVFEIDFGVHMNLIATNDVLIYTNAATDPYSNAGSAGSGDGLGADGAWNTELQNNLTNTIGNAAYDIGHLFGATGGGGNAGCIGCVCVNDTASTTDENKGSGFTSPNDAIPTGDNFDIDYVAHEMGHQFGANHTFTHATSSEGTGVQVEPGSGSTIMGYAGITSKDVQPHSDAYFHAVSIQQVTNYIKTTTCQTNTATGNAIPTAAAGLDYTIPKSTPFMLTGTGTDANTDTLTYIWEEMDNGTTNAVPSATKTSGPNFRSYTPTTSATRYFPKMSSVLTGATTTTGTEITVEALSSVARTLNFRFTVRDNHVGGPANNSDDMVVTVNATAGPFAVTVPNTAVSYPAASLQTVTWNVAGTTTNSVNCANVDILISTNGGTTWSTLLAATTNDGSESVTMPATVGTTNRIMVKGTNHIFFDVSNTNFTITASSSDTTPPSAPTLTASGTTINATNLSWTTSTDNVGVTGYEVYQGGVLIGTTTSATTFAVTGLTPATSYAFTVKAKDNAGNFSTASNTANVTTLTDTTAPSAPVLSASGTTSTTTNLSWTTSTDNVGVTGYDVYKDGVLLGSTTTATTYAVSGLIANTTYVFTVKAKDNAGNISTASNAVSVTTGLFTYCTSQGNTVTDEVIGRVQIGTIDNVSTGGTGYTDFTAVSTNLTKYTTPTITITPTWPGTVFSEGYAVFIDYNKDGDFLDSGETVWTKTASTTTPVSGTFTIPAGATLGATRMRVSLKYNAIPTACETYTYGQVEDYTVVIVADTTSPTAPTSLTASGTTQRTTNLSWTAATDNAAVTGYDVYKGAVLLGSTTSATTFAVSGLTYSTSYAFTVKAKDASGNISAASNTANVTTLTPPTTTATACSSYTWSVNNQTYATTGNYTGINGSGDTEFLNLTISSCAPTITVKFYIEGYYDPLTDAMRPVKANQGVGSSTTNVDTITLELRDSSNTLIGSTTAVLQTNGTAVCNFTSVPDGSYYLVVKHRNTIETWSAATQTVNSTPSVYDFRTAVNKAYGNNMKLVKAGVYAFYSGDINQDGFVEILDFSPLFNDSDAAAEGNYATDLNGDGFVEILDFSILFNNSDGAVESKQP
jgi:chitodextrinase